MAMGKAVKVGGGYFKGYKIPVSATPGNYNLVITNTDGAALSAITFIPDAYGIGDTFELRHMADAAGTGRCVQILGENVYNMGGGIAISLDLPAIQPIGRTESLKLTYVNTASKALNVYAIAEWVGIRKTS